MTGRDLPDREAQAARPSARTRLLPRNAAKTTPNRWISAPRPDLGLNARASAARCLTDGPHRANIVAGGQPSGGCQVRIGNDRHGTEDYLGNAGFIGFSKRPENRLDRGIIRNVAIVVQPHQEISNDPNRKYGGVERVVTHLIEGLLDRNVAVSLYTAKKCRLDCRVVYPLGISDGGKIREYIYPTQLDTYSRKIREDLECTNFDVINNHYDPVTFLALQNIRTPTITTLHGPATEENVNIFGAFPESHFSAISRAQKNSYPLNMNFVGAGFVYNSIDDNHPFSDKKRNYLLSVSRIEPIKGQKNAIKIAKKCGLDLIIAGNCLDKEYFHKKVRPHLSRDLSKPEKQSERREFMNGISKYRPDVRTIIYVGEVNEYERDQLMKHAKAFLFPIEVEESFGLVLIEAGIVGTPVIAFNRGAIPEIIEHGKTGYYGNTIDQLVGFTGRASEINAADCREHVKRRFNNDIMVESYLELYRTISATHLA